ncbi:flavodoxin [Micromonospora sp. CA-269861]|uniref:flavodoxin n=1 Tax=Micromonospora sp. CA-269861 TaxID=3239968 RepID=UPI003D91A5FE
MVHLDTPMLGRRSLLRLGLAGLAGVGLTGCDRSSPTDSEPSAMTTSSDPARGTVLLAYFSRAGENYHNGGRRTLSVGNTEVVAEMIRAAIGCDVYRINAADPYPDSYDAAVARNVREQDADSRPKIADPLPSLSGYGTVVLGSPIWNVRPPMIMSTFTEALDLTGKNVFPLTTHAMSGLGRAVEEYTASCPGATIGEGLAVRGEEASDSEPILRAWLQRIGLLQR